MPDLCGRDPDRLDALREWAWERGRTDIVLDLDLHASAWAFQDSPIRPNLVRLSAILSGDRVGGELAAALRRMAVTGCHAGDLGCLQEALQAWCPELCTRVTAGLQEMAADHTWAEGGGPVVVVIRHLQSRTEPRRRGPPRAQQIERNPGGKTAAIDRARSPSVASQTHPPAWHLLPIAE